ncbi:MAG: acetate--CoA ligase family protein [Proteobacteria bacterium]|nr:acetate--CoA ligase family protein [Pseudomonadota bacterium]
MKRFFFPQSVAVFGVSAARSNLGRIIVENMERFGFKDDLYLIGDRDEKVMGRKIYRNIEEVEVIPDLAVFLIPAAGLPKALDACGRKGIRRAIIESAGFSEFGEEKKALEKEILDVIKQWDIRIVGPNCVGIVNMENGLTLPFYPMHPKDVKQGPVALISQSGGLVHDIIMLSFCENVGVGKLVSIGNKLMLDENDFLEFLIADPATQIIGLYLENIRDGRRFMNLASSTDKPIILLKSNISPSSHKIASFHTSALAGDEQVLDAALKQAGVHRVHNINEMVECFKIFSLPVIKGPKLALMSRSGGHAVLSADAVYRHKFELAEFSDDFFSMVKQKSRAGIIKMTNPLDLGDIFDINFHVEIAEIALRERGVDGLVFIHAYAFGDDVGLTRDFVKTALEISGRCQKPIVFCMISHKDDWFSMKEVADFPIFTDVDQALKMLAKSFEHYTYRSKQTVKSPRPMLRSEYQRLPSSGSSMMMPVQEAFELIKSFQLPVADYAVVKGLEEGIDAAQSIGYPVALKVASSHILHKTEKGGVKLDLKDKKEFQDAFLIMDTEEYLVQKMFLRGYEVFIGGKNDPEFGPVILFGLGGIFVEVYKEIAIRVLPIDENTAKEMVKEVKGASILQGYRGMPPADMRSLTACLVSVSRLLSKHSEIVNLDINPLIVMEEGKGCVVVDANIEYYF